MSSLVRTIGSYIPRNLSIATYRPSGNKGNEIQGLEQRINQLMESLKEEEKRSVSDSDKILTLKDRIIDIIR